MADSTLMRGHVALFATCLVDAMRPSVGFAAADLIEAAGYEVDVPQAQTCCGQPQYNSGDKVGAQALAKQAIELLEPYDYVVVPSGSCAGMIAKHYPILLAGEGDWAHRARSLGQRVHELTSFLVDVARIATLPDATQEDMGEPLERPDKTSEEEDAPEDEAPEEETIIALHDSCSCLREVRSEAQPRALLNMVGGLTYKDLPGRHECCGFGGTFCVKYPEISTHMVDAKISDIEASGAKMVTSADLGCLLNIAGRLHRCGKSVQAWHIAEILTGRHRSAPPICPK